MPQEPVLPVQSPRPDALERLRRRRQQAEDAARPDALSRLRSRRMMRAAPIRVTAPADVQEDVQPEEPVVPDLEALAASSVVRPDVTRALPTPPHQPEHIPPKPTELVHVEPKLEPATHAEWARVARQLAEEGHEPTRALQYPSMRAKAYEVPGLENIFARFHAKPGVTPTRPLRESLREAAIAHVKPGVAAVPEPDFGGRLAEAAVTQVKEKYREKSAAPGAPSAMSRRERAAARQAEQVRTYGEAAGRSPEQIAADTEQDIVDMSADEGGWANEIGTMLGDFVDPTVLVAGVGAERAAMAGLQRAAARGIPLARRLLRLANTPEGASLMRRLVARAAHGLATGGAINVAAAGTLAAEEGRVPTVPELLMAGATGTALGPAFEVGGAAVAAPFAAGGAERAAARLAAGRSLTEQAADLVRAAARETDPNVAARLETQAQELYARAQGPAEPKPAAPAAERRVQPERRAAPRGGALERIRRRVGSAIAGTDIDALETAATQDPRTGALNPQADQVRTQAALTERAEGERIVRYRLDMDNFKALNDERGHAAGDAALQSVKDALEQELRPEDLVTLSRMGGDEFAVTMRIADQADAAAIRDRLEAAVNQRLTQEGLDVAGERRVGASIGFAEATDEMSATRLDELADLAARGRKAERAVSRPRAEVSPESQVRPEPIAELPPTLEQQVAKAATIPSEGRRAEINRLRGEIEAARRRGDISHIQADDFIDTLEQRLAVPEPAEPAAAAAPKGPREYVPMTGTTRALTDAEIETRNIARALKGGGSPDELVAAVRTAAPEMAQRVPENAILVPVPSARGGTLANGMLASAIAELRPGVTVVDALDRINVVEGSQMRRRAGRPGLTAEEQAATMRVRQAAGTIPTERPIVLIDNVETTGATAEGARRVLHRADAELVTFARAPIPAGEVHVSNLERVGFQSARAGVEPPPPLPSRIEPTPGAVANRATQPFETMQLEKPLAAHTVPELEALEAQVTRQRLVAQAKLDEGAVGSTQPFDYDLQVLRDEMDSRAMAAALETPNPEHMPAAPVPERVTLGRPLEGVNGAEAVVKNADGSAVRVRYKVVEAEELVTSHDPETFALQEGYPEGIQERRYHADKVAQEEVARVAQQLDPDIVLDPTTRPTEGPGIATRDGVVLSGNQRTMAIKRAYRRGAAVAAAYRQALVNKATGFTLNPEAIRQMERPVLIREIIPTEALDLSDRGVLAELVARFNDVATKAKDPLADAATRARRLRDAEDVLEHFGTTIEADQTLRDYLGTPAGRDFVEQLVQRHVLPRQEAARFVDRFGAVTDEGKGTIERMLYAAAIGDPEVAGRAPKPIMRRLEHAIPAIVKVSRISGWDLGPVLREALDLHAEMQAKGFKSITELLEQGALFGRHDTPPGITLADFLDRVTAKAEVTAAFREYADLGVSATTTRETVDMFGYEPPSPVSAFAQKFANGKSARVSELEGAYTSARMSQHEKIAYAGGAAEVRQRAGDLWVSAGELARATDEQIELPFVSDPATRRAWIQRAKQPRAWVDVRGQVLTGPTAYHKFLHPFRSPSVERLHAIILDDNGRILAHTMETSGMVNTVWVKDDFAWRIAQRAKRVGGRRVVISHNHPSGNATPSADDIAFTGQVGAALEQRGIKLEGQYVIDDVEGTWIEHHGEGYSKRFFKFAPIEKQRDWTDPHAATPIITDPTTAHEQLLRNLVSLQQQGGLKIPDAQRFDVLYLTSESRAVALEPHHIDALKTLQTWLPQHIRANGAKNVIIGVLDEAKHAPTMTEVVKALQVPELAEQGTSRLRRGLESVLDIINVATGESRAERGAMPRQETVAGGRFAHEETVPRARRVFEQGERDRAADKGELAPYTPLEGGWQRRVGDVQEDLFGRPTVAGPEQTELLPERAGRRVEKLQTEKIRTAEEIARVRREGAEPAGERPAEMFGAEQLDPELERRLRQMHSTYQRALQTEKGEGLANTILNARASIEHFQARGVSADHPVFQNLEKQIAAQEGRVPAKWAKRLREGEGRYDPTKDAEEAGIPQTPGDPNINPASRAQIVRGLAEALEVPIRTGKMRQRRALGIYKVKPEAIRLRVANDIETAAHEVGHHLHTLLFDQPYTKRGALSSMVLKPWRDELKPLGAGVSDQSTAEGLAEFVRRYLTNPAAAKRRAPRFFDFFETTLREKHPDVLDLLIRKREDYALWLASSPRARLRAHISTQESPDHGSIRDRWTRFRTNVIDDMAWVERAVRDLVGGKGPAIQEDAITMARLARGSEGLALEFIDGKARDFKTLKPVGPSLKDVFKPVVKRLDDFRDYAIALRAQELHGRGMETGLVPGDVAAVLEELDSPLFRQTFEDLQTWNRSLLEYLRDAGVISQEALDGILENNKAYLPFYRVMDDIPKGKPTYTSARFGHVFSPVKRIRGSGREIIDPFESLVKNAHLYVSLAQRQQVSNALAQLAKIHGSGWWIEKVPAPLEKQAGVTPQQMLEAFDRKGAGVEFLDFLKEIGFVKGEGDKLEATSAMAEEILQVFRPGDWMGEPNMISVLDKGKRTWYEVHPELYEALMGVHNEELQTWVRWLSFPARTLRAGATLAPEFIGRNPVRDQIQAFITSDYGFKPGFDFARGFWHMMRGTETYGLWRASGGERASLLGLDRSALRNTFRRRVAKQGIPNVVYNPLEMLRAVSAAMEDATRIGEFARALKAEGGAGSKEALLRAAAASREVSIDFARHGAKTAALRNLTAFWNARIQGYDRLFRAVKTHPFRTLGRVFAGITAPSIALYYVNRDDPDYWRLPQWQRDLFWCVKIGGHWVRIPKPFELGIVFGSVPERMLEWWDTKDPRRVSSTLTDFALSEAKGVFLPVPNVIAPLIENLANYNLFTGRPIVPRGLEGVAPEAQVGPQTSELAEQLGRMMDYPPAKIDNLLYGWTGGVGRLASDVITKGVSVSGESRFGERPTSPRIDLPGPFDPREQTPLVRGFVAREPGASSEPVERFYEELARTSVAYETARYYERIEDPALDAWENAHQDDIDRYEDLRPVADDIAGLRAEANLIRRDPDISGDEKARQIRELEREMVQLAEEAIDYRTGARGRRGSAITRILGRAGDVMAGAGAGRVQPEE